MMGLSLVLFFTAFIAMWSAWAGYVRGDHPAFVIVDVAAGFMQVGVAVVLLAV